MSAQHIHIIDNKQVSYPNDTCPICRPEIAQPQREKFVPNVHRTGDTIVAQVSRGLMSTTTYWAKGSCFLHSIRKIARDANNKVMVGQDGKPLWTQLTMRLNMALARQYIAELSKMITEVETQQPVPQQPTPQPTPSTAPAVPKTVTMGSVMGTFPADLSAMLYFEDTPDYVTIKPRQYLGADNFRRIAAIVRDQLSGEYVSVGQDSHFRIVKPQKSTVPQRG